MLVIEGEIDKAKKQIAAYKEEFQKVRVIRKYRQEYDALAKVCVYVCVCVCVCVCGCVGGRGCACL